MALEHPSREGKRKKKEKEKESQLPKLIPGKDEVMNEKGRNQRTDRQKNARELQFVNWKRRKTKTKKMNVWGETYKIKISLTHEETICLLTQKRKEKRNLQTCYILIYMFIQHHNGTIIKTQWQRQTQEDFFNKIFTSHFICKGSKGLFKVCLWEGAGAEHKL